MMMENDPNGHDWKDAGYGSYEQWIESKAGASPPDEMVPTDEQYHLMEEYRHENDWPMPSTAPTTPPDDEDLEAPDDAP